MGSKTWGRHEELTIDEIQDKYGSFLTEEQISELQKFNRK